MQNIIKIITVFVFIFILGIFYVSLNRSSNYDTENLVGNKLSEIKLKSFYKDKNNYLLFKVDILNPGLETYAIL